MNEGTIRISASVDHDGDCTFDLTASKGKIEAHGHFFGDLDTLREFGEQLIAFPEAGINSYAAFECDWPIQFVLKVYCYDVQGHAALSVAYDNKEDEPHRCRLEFSIPAEVASFNRLGHLLLTWQVENDSELLWQAQTS
ncbi:hypothetical protein [Hymenobacter gelipurpurascens]|uniref:hypothetical protein n=1 Tax=Hymenobacter gelipurpurascens TaxID=89968 RepID=UPI001481E9E3|nr:hypothetical protein [Hymenobacter gelipurpurascens]